ncbi:MAG: hypothetical protein LAT68_12525 [Cyclobacteriaceae bacterium]|nr:hypothetical protein [Cyclobacteriaceae bacterium]MCH8517143.1 hypothetical protein [Cyclobacteriaceae bacterium]
MENSEQSLKDIWKKPGSKLELSYEKLNKVFDSYSNSLIEKFRRNIVVEHYINIITFILISIFLIVGEEYLWFYLMLVVFPPFLIYYQITINRLKNHETNQNTLEYLKSTYRLFQRFFDHYRLLSVLAGLVGFFYGTFAFWSDEGFLSVGSHTLGEWAIYILSISIPLIMIFLFFHFYLKWMYGDKLRTLKQIIAELESD